MKRKLVSMVVVLTVFTVVPFASAAVHTLIDENSTATFNTGSSAGMTSWTVDNVDHMFQQWFWYRIGPEGPEQSVDTLGIFTEGTTDTDFDGNPDNLFVRFSQRGGLQVDLNFRLEGGGVGSGASDIAETIDLTNNSDGTMQLSFFQYTDLDLGGTIWDDVAVRVNPNTIRQSDPAAIFNETVVTPAPSRWEIDYYPTTLNKLNDANADNLSNSTSPLGPGDVAWAFQWNLTLAPGATFQISKDKNLALIPAPGALLLGMLGLGVVGYIKRRFAA